jgi:hypothetical protein
MTLTAATASEASPQTGVTDLARYLETFALDHEAREILDAGPPWNDDRTSLVVRVLLRIMLAPPEFTEAWREAAVPITALATPPGDCFTHAVGRAVFVAELRLPEELTALTGRHSIDLVRLRTDRSVDIDVVTDAAPRAWPRGRDIDEPAEVFGLPVAARTGPAPTSAAGDVRTWPAEPPALLLAAARVAWHPPKLPGSVGMDVGLLDSVIDGQKLTAADADAFYGLLAAAGRAGKGAVAAAAGVRELRPRIQQHLHGGIKLYQKLREVAVSKAATATTATAVTTAATAATSTALTTAATYTAAATATAAATYTTVTTAATATAAATATPGNTKQL